MRWPRRTRPFPPRENCGRVVHSARVAFSIGWFADGTQARRTPCQGEAHHQGQLDKALEEQKQLGGRLGEHLVRLGHVSEEDILDCLSQQYGVPSINLTPLRHRRVDHQADPGRCRAQVPVHSGLQDRRDADRRDGRPDQRVRDGRHHVHHRLQRRAGGGRPRRRSARRSTSTTAPPTPSSSRRSWRTCPPSTRPPSRCSRRTRRSTSPTLEAATDEAPVVRLVNIILTDAIKRSASDIHIEPYEKDFRVPLPHRRRAVRDHEPADEAQGRDHLPHQDPGEARHRREATAPGRPHQDQDEAPGQAQGARLPRLDPARPCSARRSCCGCSTRTT